MRELTIQELQEIDGGSCLLTFVTILGAGLCFALGWYNGRKSTELDYD